MKYCITVMLWGGDGVFVTIPPECDLALLVYRAVGITHPNCKNMFEVSCSNITTMFLILFQCCYC